MGRSGRQRNQNKEKPQHQSHGKAKISRNRPNHKQLNTMIEFMEDNHDFAHESMDDQVIYRHLLHALTRKLNKLGKIARDPEAVQKSWRDQKQNTLDREQEFLSGLRQIPLSDFDQRILRVIRRLPPVRESTTKPSQPTIFRSTPKEGSSASIGREEISRSEMPKKNEYFYDDDDVSSWERQSDEDGSEDQENSENSTDDNKEIFKYPASEKYKASRKLSSVNWTPNKESTKKSKIWSTPVKSKTKTETDDSIKYEDSSEDFCIIVSDEENSVRSGIENKDDSPMEIAKKHIEILREMIFNLRLAFKKQQDFLSKYLK